MSSAAPAGYDPLGPAALDIRQAIEPAPTVVERVSRLSASLWPPCPLCTRVVDQCRCDPDLYAVLVRLQGLTAGAEADAGIFP